MCYVHEYTIDFTDAIVDYRRIWQLYIVCVTTDLFEWCSACQRGTKWTLYCYPGCNLYFDVNDLRQYQRLAHRQRLFKHNENQNSIHDDRWAMICLCNFPNPIKLKVNYLCCSLSNWRNFRGGRIVCWLSYPASCAIFHHCDWSTRFAHVMHIRQCNGFVTKLCRHDKCNTLWSWLLHGHHCSISRGMADSKCKHRAF